MKHRTKAGLLAGLLVFTLRLPAAAADRLPYDHDGSGTLNAADLTILKRERLKDTAYGAESLSTLRDFLVRRGGISADGTFVLEPKGTIHTGEGTFYGGGYKGGCCMLEPIPAGLYVCAMNLRDYNNAMLAGAYVEVTGPTGTVQMLVTDLLPEGKLGDIDFNIDAFPLVAPLEAGRVKVSWKIIPFPTEEPVSYRFKEGSTKFWCGVQVRNHRYPVAKLEYLNADGEFVELPRRQYNYFISSDMGAGPFTFRVTSIYGDVFVDEGIPMTVEADTPGQGQFPA